VIHLILHLLGLDSATGPAYLAWSGFGGDLALIGGAAGLLHRYNCHTRGCWRLGREQVAGTTLVVCRRHHPGGKPTPQDVLRQARGQS
jgi:hypothetical protein